MQFCVLLPIVSALVCGAPATAAEEPVVVERPEGVPARPVATYSIVARDGETGHIGVAVQSHWFDVGGVVPWAKAGVGVVATQSLVRVEYGPEGLALLDAGVAPTDALAQLVEADEGRAYRQVAMMNAEGQMAQHTGDLCISVAEQAYGQHMNGSFWACQANMMNDKGVPAAMARAFARKEGALAERLLAALKAGEMAGGDIRGMQSAAILVVQGEPVEEDWQGVVVDLSVEDNPRPLLELERLLNLHLAYEHMNAGDRAMETGDVEAALEEYNAAMLLAPGKAEMVFWTAVSLAAAGRADEAEPLFARVYKNPGEGDWRELLRRLPDSDLFPDDPALLERMLNAGGEPR
jgi:uncharacterized Ntn-hydrolase superfamily protein